MKIVKVIYTQRVNMATGKHKLSIGNPNYNSRINRSRHYVIIFCLCALCRSLTAETYGLKSVIINKHPVWRKMHSQKKHNEALNNHIAMAFPLSWLRRAGKQSSTGFFTVAPYLRKFLLTPPSVFLCDNLIIATLT